MATKKTEYFPFGFRYPSGLHHDDQNPDPKIEDVRDRMAYLNKVHAKSGLPGHIFAATMDLFQSESPSTPDIFWNAVRRELTMTDVAEIAKALAPAVSNSVERLDFPNAIALFDCRFVSTAEWEHIRRYSIGGSEAATVLGLSHFQSPRSLFHEKRNPVPKTRDVGRDHILDYGHAVEDYIVESFASRLGAVRVPEFRMFAHKDYPFLTCNPDGLFLFADGHLSLFEAKTAFWKKRDDWKDGIPSYYEPQPRHYLEVLNDPRLNDGYIGVCLGGGTNDLIPQHYVRDKALGAQQVQTLVEFWRNHIAANVPPALCGDAELDMEAAYGYLSRTSGGNRIENLSVDTIPEFQRYFDLKEQRKDIDKQKNLAKKEEESLLDELEGYFPDGMSICAIPGEMPYRIKVKDKSQRKANISSFRPGDLHDIRYIANSLAEVSHGWTTPKVSSEKLRA